MHRRTLLQAVTVPQHVVVVVVRDIAVRILGGVTLRVGPLAGTERQHQLSLSQCARRRKEEALVVDCARPRTSRLFAGQHRLEIRSSPEEAPEGPVRLARIVVPERVVDRIVPDRIHDPLPDISAQVSDVDHVGIAVEVQIEYRGSRGEGVVELRNALLRTRRAGEGRCIRVKELPGEHFTRGDIHHVDGAALRRISHIRRQFVVGAVGIAICVVARTEDRDPPVVSPKRAAIRGYAHSGDHRFRPTEAHVGRLAGGPRILGVDTIIAGETPEIAGIVGRGVTGGLGRLCHVERKDSLPSVPQTGDQHGSPPRELGVSRIQERVHRGQIRAGHIAIEPGVCHGRRSIDGLQSTGKARLLRQILHRIAHGARHEAEQLLSGAAIVPGRGQVGIPVPRVEAVQEPVVRPRVNDPRARPFRLGKELVRRFVDG